MSTFAEKIQKLLEQNCEYAPEIGIAIQQLPSESTADMKLFSYFLNEDSLMATASTMKLFVLGALLEKSDRDGLDLDAFITLKKEDITPGSGVLEHLTTGMTLTARDLATLMVIVSDNTATNMCIDLCGGLPTVNAHIARLGIRNASVNRKIYDKSPNPLKKRLADVSAKAFSDYLIAIRCTNALSETGRNLFFNILKKNQHKDMFGRFLPLEDYNEHDGNAPSLMNKNGWSDGTRTDAGILRLTDGREYSYSVLINKCRDMSYAVTNKGAELIGRIGQIFYEEISN